MSGAQVTTGPPGWPKRGVATAYGEGERTGFGFEEIRFRGDLVSVFKAWLQRRYRLFLSTAHSGEWVQIMPGEISVRDKRNFFPNKDNQPLE